ncbi:MAG: membrane dipeptidase [Planctomycetota bacterium]|nr:membrane dipeptidase [Planctomycetota bacterium]
MNWIDGHLDLAYMHLTMRDIRKACQDPTTQSISLPDLKTGQIDIAYATIFTEPDPEEPDSPCGYPKDDIDAAFRAGMNQMEVYVQLESENLVRIVKTRQDLDSQDEGRQKLVLLMEGADPIRSPEDVAYWFEQGIRQVGLSWWHGTRFSGGNGNHGPLTTEGLEMVQALDETGIIHDASHLADESFDMLLEHVKGPIVASHSNCRVLMDGKDHRHLRDDQIKAISDRGRGRGGVVGLNLYSAFLTMNGRATLQDCVNHVLHICEVMGHKQGVALGSDADGGFPATKLPIDVDHPTKYINITNALRDEGWTEEELKGFASGNWLRILREALPA